MFGGPAGAGGTVVGGEVVAGTVVGAAVGGTVGAADAVVAGCAVCSSRVVGVDVASVLPPQAAANKATTATAIAMTERLTMIKRYWPYFAASTRQLFVASTLLNVNIWRPVTLRSSMSLLNGISRSLGS